MNRSRRFSLPWQLLLSAGQLWAHFNGLPDFSVAFFSHSCSKSTAQLRAECSASPRLLLNGVLQNYCLLPDSLMRPFVIHYEVLAVDASTVGSIFRVICVEALETARSNVASSVACNSVFYAMFISF